MAAMGVRENEILTFKTMIRIICKNNITNLINEDFVRLLAWHNEEEKVITRCADNNEYVFTQVECVDILPTK
jgi:hypothetical protein